MQNKDQYKRDIKHFKTLVTWLDFKFSRVTSFKCSVSLLYWSLSSASTFSLISWSKYLKSLALYNLVLAKFWRLILNDKKNFVRAPLHLQLEKSCKFNDALSLQSWVFCRSVDVETKGQPLHWVIHNLIQRLVPTELKCSDESVKTQEFEYVKLKDWYKRDIEHYKSPVTWLDFVTILSKYKKSNGCKLKCYWAHTQ